MKAGVGMRWIFTTAKISLLFIQIVRVLRAMFGALHFVPNPQCAISILT